MDAYTLQSIIEDIDGIEFDVELPEQFYGTIPVEDCEDVLFGSSIKKLSCDSCDWELDSEEIAKFEHEYFLPPDCLSCGSEYSVVGEENAFPF